MTVDQFYFLFIGLYGLYVVWTYFTSFFMACQQKNSEGDAVYCFGADEGAGLSWVVGGVVGELLAAA